MNQTTFTRQQLYELVWAQPMLTLSRKYNISDVGLRKICVRMNIPLPSSGYWNKVKVGQSPAITPLGNDYEGEAAITLTLREEGQSQVEEGLTPVAALQKAIELDKTIDLKVRASLVNPDPLIVAAQAALTKKNKHYQEGDMLFTGSGLLDIRATETSLNRALCFMDAFVKIMRQRGHDFKFRNDETYLVIGTEEIQLALREMQNTVRGEDRWSTRSYMPNGILNLQFGRKSSSGGAKDAKLSLELQLSRIIARLEIKGEEQRVASVKHAAWLIEYREKERLAKEAAERRKLEVLSFQKALRAAARWKETMALREYIDHVEQQAQSQNPPNEEQLAWVDWARQKADWYDPLLETEDEWLKNLNRDQILEYEAKPQSAYGFSYHQENSATQSNSKWPLLPWYTKIK